MKGGQKEKKMVLQFLKQCSELFTLQAEPIVLTSLHPRFVLLAVQNIETINKMMLLSTISSAFLKYCLYSHIATSATRMTFSVYVTTETCRSYGSNMTNLQNIQHNQLYPATKTRELLAQKAFSFRVTSYQFDIETAFDRVCGSQRFDTIKKSSKTKPLLRP